MRHLILRLQGPLMSFGTVAIDERLPTARFPALSMVCGLLANAVGMSRRWPQEIQALQDGMEIASRLDRPGEFLRDYQTAGLNKTDKGWTSWGRLAGRDGGTSGDMTVQIEKEYWADAAVTVAVSLPEVRIDPLAAALREPARPLFLGRAGCPPSCDILLDIVEADDVLDAIERAPLAEYVGKISDGFDAQWPRRLGAGRPARSVDVSDRKAWAHRVHLGLRPVREGKILMGGSL